ncbi:SUKH-4 family immunity protein [Streptomyces geranii]|uniref:SUKH-4 family immunity protein n=1 Tax=Streptomyces geranii TaxID=2058923 RepID=UPI000D02C512|nr:SUKH-4 family immunity protein [Streptomyces geranii]
MSKTNTLTRNGIGTGPGTGTKARTRAESLTRVALPAGRGRLRFGALRNGALRNDVLRAMANATGEPPRTRHRAPDRRTSSARRPPASALEALLRFAAATEELAVARGRFASYAGRSGARTVAETSRHLLTVFARSANADVLPYWKMAALIRPLARIATPGTESGLALDLPARLLEQEFGHGRVARFEPLDFPPTLTHEPTRVFLSSTGLPEDDCHFHLDTEIPLPTLAEYCADEDTPTELPQGAADLIRLGALTQDNSLVLDGRTGTLLAWNEPETTLHRLNTDVATFAYTLWLLRRARRIDFEGEAGRVR